MSQAYSVRLNIEQNSPDFRLEPLDQQPSIFKYKLFKKTLDNAKENPKNINNYRTVTIKCLYKYYK